MERPRRVGSTVRRTSTWIAVLLLLGTGMVLAEEHLRVRPDAYGEAVPNLEGLDGEKLRDVEGSPDGDEPWPACMANEFSVPGQGVHVSGSVGGLLSSPDASTEDARPKFVDQGTRALLEDLVRNAAHDVAILVVDDFGPATHVVDDSGQRTEEHVFRVSHDFEQAPESRAELERLVQDGKVSHGALVLHHSVELATEVLKHHPHESSAGDRYEWDLNGARLIVRAVPLLSENADTIAGTINDAISEAEDDPGVNHIVVNMSWVLLPCDVVDDFEAGEYKHFDAYLNALRAQNDGRHTLEELEKLVTWVEREDAMGRHVSEQGWAHEVLDRVAYVAAAGNFGLSYQMYPAAWPTVTGASADASYSNEDGVIERGGLFRLERRDVYYLGTSFTAPALSLAAALDMSSKTPACSPWSPGTPSPFEHKGNAWLHDAWC